ncbi:hypothetical protein LINPERPRIM_LOCUS28028 [Linum perenne]
MWPTNAGGAIGEDNWQKFQIGPPIVSRKLRKSVNLSFPSDSSSGTIRQVTRLGFSFAGISWTSSGSPEFLKACRSSGSRDGVSAIERVP